MKDISKEDLEKYRNYLTEDKDCAVCGGKSDRLWARCGSFKAVQCSLCGFIWINPSLSQEGLEKYYADYIGMRFKDEEKTKQRKIQYGIDKDFIEAFITKGKVLDVGCSGGFFLDVLGPDFKKHGIEVDPAAVEYARRSYPFGRDIKHCRLENAPFPSESFDLIIMRGVIEHLPDLHSALSKAESLLKPGGYYYIAATPNAGSFCAGIYREKWNLFHPIRHLSYFDLNTTRKMMLKYGLKFLDKEFPYLETPYADLLKDHLEMLDAFLARKKGSFRKIGRSRAFWGNIMNLIFRKEN